MKKVRQTKWVTQIINATNLCPFLFVPSLLDWHNKTCPQKTIDLLLGNGLQFSLLLVLLGQLSEAGQRGVHLLDGQEALGGSWERFALLKEHPHRLRHVSLKEPGWRHEYKQSNCWSVSKRRINISGSYLLQIAHHYLLVAPEDAAEQLHDLLVVQIVDALDDAWQKQLHCQVQIPVELIWRPGKVSFSFILWGESWTDLRPQALKLTSARAFPEELLYDLRLGIVTVVLRHHGAQLAELSEKAVLVLGVTELRRQAAALAHFGRRCRRSWAWTRAGGGAGAAGFCG